MNKQARNYFELKDNHNLTCVIDCNLHSWWCIIHIRDHNGCDCNLKDDNEK